MFQCPGQQHKQRGGVQAAEFLSRMHWRGQGAGTLLGVRAFLQPRNISSLLTLPGKAVQKNHGPGSHLSNPRGARGLQDESPSPTAKTGSVTGIKKRTRPPSQFDIVF